MIKLKGKELDEIAERKEGGVSVQNYRGAVPVPPSALHNLHKHLTDQLDASIGKHHSLLDGIVLGYKNVKVMGDLGSIRNDTSDVTFDVQMNVYLFQPKVGDVLSGVINKKSDTHLSVLVHKMFNVVIPRPAGLFRETWVGTRLQEGQRVTFQIMVLDLFGALPYIRGALRDSDLPPDAIDELDMGVVDFSKISKTPNGKTKKNINKSTVDDSFAEFVKKKATDSSSSSTPITMNKKKKNLIPKQKIKLNGINDDSQTENQFKSACSSDDSFKKSTTSAKKTKMKPTDCVSSSNNKNKNKVVTKQLSPDSDSDSDFEENRSLRVKALLEMSKRKLESSSSTKNHKEDSENENEQSPESEKKSLIDLLLKKTRESIGNSKHENDDDTSSDDDQTLVKSAQKRKFSDSIEESSPERAQSKPKKKKR